MSVDWVAGVISAIKSPKLVASGALSTGLLLSFPDAVIKSFGLESFLIMARPFVAVTFVVASSILAVELVAIGHNHLSSWRRSRRQRREVLVCLKNLDHQEICVLREFFLQERNTIKLLVEHPVVIGLFRKGILCQVGRFADRIAAGIVCSCELSPIAKNALIRADLSIPDAPTMSERQIIQAQRPQFVGEIFEHDQLFGAS